jgi:hypothetical protein
MALHDWLPAWRGAFFQEIIVACSCMTTSPLKQSKDGGSFKMNGKDGQTVLLDPKISASSLKVGALSGW